MPTARELVLEIRDEQAFLAAHRAPALVFDAPDAEDEDSVFDTPPQPFLTRGVTPIDADEAGGGTDVLAAIDLTATGLASDALQAQARVEWLVKTERNPF